jgi:hypothetical protein
VGVLDEYIGDTLGVVTIKVLQGRLVSKSLVRPDQARHYSNEIERLEKLLKHLKP